LGTPTFGVSIKLLDREGRVITTPNTAGEAYVYSTTSAPFYWRKQDQSLATFAGGWTRTGDELWFDEDGFYWFSGRANELFKVKGLWISPIEIEAELTAHPAVYEAAVVPHVNAEGLTEPRAFVVLRPGFDASDDLTVALQTGIKARIGGYKVPRSIVYTEALPRTTLMKIDRRALREHAATGAAMPPNAPSPATVDLAVRPAAQADR
jgi:benzoate-CoA ligase